LISATFWAGIIWHDFNRDPAIKLDANSIYILVLGVLLLGIAYGSFYGVLIYILNPILAWLDRTNSIKQFESTPRSFRIAIVLLATHSLSVLSLDKLGLWKQSWPSIFGLFPWLI